MARTQKTLSALSKQSGLSLVELIIAMGLGVAILGAAIQFSLSSRQLSTISAENNFLAQNARLAQAIISRDLRMGGYRGLGEGHLPAPFLSLACGADASCTVDGGGSGNDKIAVIYQSAADDLSGGRDCSGTAANPGQLIANQYYIEVNNNISSLMCRSFDVAMAAATTVTARQGEPVALIDGIESMQLLYGVASSTGGTQFVNAANVANWGKVQAVRLAFLVSDGLNQGSLPQKARSYALLDATAKEYDDKITRHVFTTTIELNNTFK